jgi:hypothetical protein
MNRTAVAAELVAMAKSIMAIPMEFNDPSSQTTRWARKTLMMTLNVDATWKQIYESFLTYREGTSNKFHYFGVFKNRTTGECVGGNAYGRIGYNPKAIEVDRGSEGSVMSTVRQKMSIKQNKGYAVTEV